MAENEHFQIKIDCDLSPNGDIQMCLEGPQNAVLILKILAVTQKAILDKVTWTPPPAKMDKRQPASVFRVVAGSEKLKN